MGGNFHLKLNIVSRPIVNKYREGKVKRTLKRELKVPEIAGGEAIETSELSKTVWRLLDSGLYSAQALQVVLKAMLWMFLALRVSISSDWGKIPGVRALRHLTSR